MDWISCAKVHFLHLLSLISGLAFPSFIYFSLIQIFSVSSSYPSIFPPPFPSIPPSSPSLLDISVPYLKIIRGIFRLHTHLSLHGAVLALFVMSMLSACVKQTFSKTHAS